MSPWESPGLWRERFEMGKRLVVAVGLRELECDPIRGCLSPCPVDVLPVPSVDEGILQPVARAPLVFCDTETCDWRDALSAFLRRWPGVRVVFLSQRVDGGTWLDMLEAGAYDLLVRPFRLVEIHWIARGALLGAGMVC